MPAAMAGLRGGKIGSRKDRSEVDFSLDLISGRLNSDQIRAHVIHERAPKTVTLVVNNSCNLACRHCYLQVEKLTAGALRVEEWERLSSSILDTAPELICLSGKEVFLGKTGPAVIKFLAAQRAAGRGATRLGVITNGTLIEPHYDLIEQADFSYFDISIDGIEEDHDAVRGQGAFAQLAPNLSWASRTLGKRLFVSQTFQRRNFQNFVKTVAMLDQFGVENIGCGFYRPLAYTDQSLTLSAPEIDEVFSGLSKLESIELDSPKVILFELDTVQMTALSAFFRSRWFDANAIISDENGNLYLEHELKNGLKLQFRFSLTPSLVFDSSRITPEGNYLAADDTIDTSKYARYSLGNVRDYGFDFPALHRAGARSGRLVEILDNYLEFTLPLLQREFTATMGLKDVASPIQTLKTPSHSQSLNYVK